MKNLLKYMKQYRFQAVLGPFFKLTEALFELFVPLVVADIIDQGIGNGDKSFIISRGILMAVLGVVGFICALIAQYFAANASVGFASNLRVALFKKIRCSGNICSGSSYRSSKRMYCDNTGQFI